MSISFSQVPANIRVPLSYIEIDASNQNQNAPTAQRILVLGQMLSTGAALPNVPVLVTSYQQAVALFGLGSNLANMFYMLFQNSSFVEKWACPASDNGGGTAASATITMAGTATAAGTLSLYLGGTLIPVSVASGDTATVQGASVASAINASPILGVTATSTTGVVTLTFNHKGTIGNYYDIRFNYHGAKGGESFPAGVTAPTIVAMSGGTTDPTLTSVIAGLPEKEFDYWLFPWQGATPIAAIQTELASRWSPLRMLEGHAFGAAGGTTSALVTLGNSLNSQFLTIQDAGNGSPTPSYLWAAALCGQVAESGSIDPGRPFTTLPLVGILPPAVQNGRSLTDQNSLLYDGIATYTRQQDGTVTISRTITTYQTNALGIADGVYLDTNTMLILSYLRQSLREMITTTFSRMKLAQDGTRIGAGQAIVTPAIIKSAIIAWAVLMNQAGLIQNLSNFNSSLIVQINQNDPTRVDVQLTPTLVTGLYIIAAAISFIL